MIECRLVCNGSILRVDSFFTSIPAGGPSPDGRSRRRTSEGGEESSATSRHRMMLAM
jgi:hypothetical protein